MNTSDGHTSVTGAKCVICGHAYGPEYLKTNYVCHAHPDYPNEGILDITYDYARSAKNFPAPDQPGMWRYRALLPLPHTAKVPSLLTGMTPLYDAARLARKLGVRRLLLKDDARQPTSSFKDRASSLAVALAKWRNAPVVATASTGNAAAALAGMSAAMQQACVIFVPVSAPPAKLAQLAAYGANVFLVEGSYDDAFDLCMAACAEWGWYNRNTGFNPNMAEGKKTAAFEICEQNRWQVPDAVFVGVGDGCIMAGLHKGFADLVRLGLTGKMPRLYGVQAEGSDFMYQAYAEGRFSPVALLAKTPIRAVTAADSICAGLPRDRVKAMNAICQTEGCFLRVTDKDILEAVTELAGQTGVFAEPAGAAPLAGLKQALQTGLLNASETACLVITGSGLKDPGAVGNTIFEPRVVKPDLASLSRLVDQYPPG